MNCKTCWRLGPYPPHSKRTLIKCCSVICSEGTKLPLTFRWHWDTPTLFAKWYVMMLVVCRYQIQIHYFSHSYKACEKFTKVDLGLCSFWSLLKWNAIFRCNFVSEAKGFNWHISHILPEVWKESANLPAHKWSPVSAVACALLQEGAKTTQGNHWVRHPANTLNSLKGVGLQMTKKAGHTSDF